MFLLKKDYWQIKKTKEKGYGVFAKKRINAGTIIGDYLGKVLKTSEYDPDKDESTNDLTVGVSSRSLTSSAISKPSTLPSGFSRDKNGLYLMYHTDQAFIYPNLNKPGIHLFNHSCVPNCWIYTYCGHTLFFALREINPGEELTISYLLSPKSENCKPCLHTCKCNSKFCTGTMHLPEDKYKRWQKFQNTEKRKTKTAKFVFGKNLPKLTSYPKIIPNNPIYAMISSG